MGVAGGRLDLRVSQQFADHGQALAERECAGSERMAEVVNSLILQVGRADPATVPDFSGTFDAVIERA